MEGLIDPFLDPRTHPWIHLELRTPLLLLEVLRGKKILLGAHRIRLSPIDREVSELSGLDG
jgi:hypothetical protein